MHTTKYELGRLEGIIAQDISPYVAMQCKVSRTLLDDFESAISEETARIKLSFSQATFILKRKRKMRKYIQHHQQALIRLSCYLLRYTPPEMINGTRHAGHVALCQRIYLALDELLSFVEKHFAQHVKLDVWVPEDYRRISVTEIKRSLKDIENGLLQQDIDPALMDVVLQPLRKFAGNGYANKLTFRKVNYLRKLKKELLHLANRSGNHDKPSEALQFLLIELNFNYREYFHYCTGQIRNFIEGAESLSESIERLALVQKLVYQAPVRAGMEFSHNQRPLKDQLSDWIAREMGYLEKRQQLMVAGEFNADPRQPGFRLTVGLSVAQLAYLIHVLVEAEIIQSRNLSLLLRMIAGVCRTKRTETVSYESLRLKYYEPESNTRLFVKNMLLKIAEQINT